jgi:hypothetical protein
VLVKIIAASIAWFVRIEPERGSVHDAFKARGLIR